MKVKQISIMVENEGGKLAETTDFLARCGINMRTLSIADTITYGILRVIVSDPDSAAEMLKKGGFTIKVNEVVVSSVDDRPGGLANAVKKLSDAGISIEYAYAFPSASKNKAYMIFRVDQTEKAEELIGTDDFDY